MAHQHPTYQEPPHPVSGDEFLGYQEIVARAFTTVGTAVEPYVSYIANVDVEVARSYIKCGFWVGVSIVAVMKMTFILLHAFYRVVNTQDFPNIQAVHQLAAVNDQTFQWIMAVYLVSVYSFSYQYGGLAIEEYWWACMQILCTAEVVVLTSMLGIWTTFRVTKWVLRRIFGVDEPVRHYRWQ